MTDSARTRSETVVSPMSLGGGSLSPVASDASSPKRPYAPPRLHRISIRNRTDAAYSQAGDHSLRSDSSLQVTS